MESKKSKDADLERLRVPLFATGLLFIGSIVLASFTYHKGVVSEDSGATGKRTANIVTEIVNKEPEKQEDTPPPPASIDVPPPPAEEIKVEKNKNDTVVKVAVAVQTEIKMGPVVVAPVEAEIIEIPDVDASFPGGPSAMKKWIAENVKYPEISQQLGEQGKVYVAFVVEPDGSITNVKVERGVSEDLDREAKRVVRAMPKWVPGENGGKKARVRCRLPINFQLG
jgi:protein TonB